MPAGFAHGFQTLVPAAEVAYMMTAPYAAASAAGVRYDDPAFAIAWPLPVTAMSAKDRSWPDYRQHPANGELPARSGVSGDTT